MSRRARREAREWLSLGDFPPPGLCRPEHRVDHLHVQHGILERVGERIINLERLFNVRENVRRADDALPWRVMHEPIPDGPSAGMYCPPAELDGMLDEYYRLRGWDTQGIPTPDRLSTLGL